MKGLLAYHAGRPVGWCHVNFKKEVAVYRTGAGDKEAMILCYVIAPDMRRKGLATMLLGEAVEMMKEKGATTIEAYPMKNPKVMEHNYHGFLEMYLAKGFRIVGEDEHTVKVVMDL
jgi:GNAT superfamily N-acetyltransferase